MSPLRWLLWVLHPPAVIMWRFCCPWSFVVFCEWAWMIILNAQPNNGSRYAGRIFCYKQGGKAHMNLPEWLIWVLHPPAAIYGAPTPAWQVFLPPTAAEIAILKLHRNNVNPVTC